MKKLLTALFICLGVFMLPKAIFDATLYYKDVGHKIISKINMSPPRQEINHNNYAEHRTP